ncbi:MAG: PAS domain S-box protein [Bacteroidales bacterium]
MTDKFKYIFDNVKDAIFVTDLEGNYLEVNQVALDRSGFTYPEFLKLNIKNTPVKNTLDEIENYLMEIINTGSSAALINYINFKGNLVETEISGKKIELDQEPVLLHISREIKNRNEKHAESLKSIIQKEEKERSRFAHEIIDILGPNLSLVKMYLDTYPQTDNLVLKNRIIDKIGIIIDRSIEGITNLSNEISPHVLKNLGLKTALEAFMKKTSIQSAIRFQYDLSIPEQLPDQVSILLYRSVIELVNNIMKHSEAKKASVFGFIDKNNIVFKVKDDGKGFNLKEALKGNSPGLTYLIGRIESIRGHIEIKSSARNGTAALIEIPLKLADE